MQFRTKARAVELLGKGQIADLPTAISELWKNGYDAYADKLEAYLYLPGYEDLEKPFFVLSDDGKGMSEKDIKEKWIVLGTDSKSRNDIDEYGEETLWKTPRIKMGEKGIGRLSVAYLGSPMLMLTKKKGSPLQALYFDWRTLENYNLFLEQVNIPLKAVHSTAEFLTVFEDIKEEFLLNFEPEEDQHDQQEEKQDPWEDQLELKDIIQSSTNSLRLPAFFIEEVVQPLIDHGSDHGTKFIIFEPEHQLLSLQYADKDEYKNDESINDIRSGLSGLANIFKEGKKEFSTSFIIKRKGPDYNLIASREFFDANDFNNCDHLIEGHFNEEGFFSGKVKVYNETVDHKFKATRPRGKTPYGPFEIKVGYVVGRDQPTILSAEQYNSINNKLKRFGGLYIYRDDFRVLPYGKPEVDFLRFEQRRTLKAGDYFFSYRRMFGYISITREANKALTDKAGREGFISNTAFREFKSDLEAFFVDIAMKYLKSEKEGKETNLRNLQQAEMRKQTLLQQQENDREIAERREFAQKLKVYPEKLERLEQEFNSIVSELTERTAASNVLYDDIKGLLARLDNCRISIKTLELNKPKRASITDNQKQNLYTYSSKYDTFNATIIVKAENAVSAAQEKLKEQELLKEFQAKFDYYKNSIRNSFTGYKNELQQVARHWEAEFSKEEKTYQKQFEEKYYGYLNSVTGKNALKNYLGLLEKEFSGTWDEINYKYTPFIRHLEKLNINVDEDSLVGFYKDEYKKIYEKWESTQELAQLGMAVEIIDHQFHVLYSQLAHAIVSFEQAIKPDPVNVKKYRILRETFEHLENNYKLLTPLYRTTGKTRREIKGVEIAEYLKNFFNEQLKEKEISFSSTDSFNNQVIYTYESVLKPVFINIINNAVYWLTPVENREIRLDFRDNKFLIMNSGAPIEDIYIQDDIFKLFFTRRPRGRGIGLYLAQTSLRSIGFDIEATNNPKYNLLNGACFIIKPFQK